jgi:hypothetical protein
MKKEWTKKYKTLRKVPKQKMFNATKLFAMDIIHKYLKKRRVKKAEQLTHTHSKQSFDHTKKRLLSDESAKIFEENLEVREQVLSQDSAREEPT